jgi:nucleotide-binding universal stress UspA family protein
MWGTKEGAAALSRSTFGEGTAGDILIVICGDRLDSTLVSLGSYMAKGAKRKACFLHVIEVPRVLPLTSILIQESERADKLLNGAMEVARRIGSETHAQVVQAREAGPAIVDEAKEHQFALLLLGLVRNTRQLPSDVDKTVAYVLANSPCRVWLVQD